MSHSRTFEVHATNIDQVRAWDGDEGAYWAAHAEHFDRAVAEYHEEFVAIAVPDASARVLDIGCGTGQTTRDAARVATEGSALGIDLSTEMIRLARRLAAEHRIGNATFEQGDAQIHAFEPGLFDAAISRTGTMFFGDPLAAFTNIARAVRAGGRLTMLVWQSPESNEWISELRGALATTNDVPAGAIDAPGPFALAQPERVERVLSAAGFSDIEVSQRRAPMWFGSDADDAYAFVVGLLGWMLGGLDEPGRNRALDRLRATLAAHQTGDGVVFASATWLVQARRA